MAACPLCASEAAALTQVVAALRAYPPPDVEVQDVAVTTSGLATGQAWGGSPAEGLGTVLAEVHAERARRSRRRLLLAAAAIAVAAVATPVALRLTDAPQRPAPATAALDVRLAGSQGSAGRATLDAERWGTAIRLRVSGLDPAARYGVWLAAEDGGRLPAGSFRPTSAGTVDLRLSAALPLSSGRVIGVTQLPADEGAEPVDVLAAQLRS